MPDHRKRPRDPSQLAKLIVDIAAGEREDRPPTPEEQGKDRAAVERGRQGGLKGGQPPTEAAFSSFLDEPSFLTLATMELTSL